MDETEAETTSQPSASDCAPRARKRDCRSRISPPRPGSRRATSKASRTATGTSFPPPTYTIGFAKNYASRGRPRPQRNRRPAARRDGRHARPVTPARGVRARRPGADHAQRLVFGAIALRCCRRAAGAELAQRSLDRRPTSRARSRRMPPRRAAAAAPAAAPATAQGPVVITANEPVWIAGQGRRRRLFKQGDARGRAELRGSGHRRRADADDRQARSAADFGRHRRRAAGRPGRRPTSRDVSLLGPDLMRGPAAPRVARDRAPRQRRPPRRARLRARRSRHRHPRPATPSSRREHAPAQLISAPRKPVGQSGNVDQSGRHALMRFR